MVVNNDGCDGTRAEALTVSALSTRKLVALGNDPFPYSSLRTPTLVFENVSVAGT